MPLVWRVCGDIHTVNVFSCIKYLKKDLEYISLYFYSVILVGSKKDTLCQNYLTSCLKDHLS